MDQDLIDEAYATLRSGLRDGVGMTGDDVRDLLAPFIARGGVEVFDGAMRLIDEDLLSRTADEERENDFFSNGLLTWEIIASGIDVPRDQAPEIADLVREQSGQLAMVVVAGGPGSGMPFGQRGDGGAAGSRREPSSDPRG